ncbi:nickel pincer cofactor biosynthesis protein LarB [Rhizobium lusitanum]|uniref:Nickel pincer cofactor biosynthesis protein LarB n=1 Tax=Rhizobium lusitanum TaxID=293958 RepID=A0A6L9UE50_9HYPH|nr:nickel pincer cofactor biosynthesis protein LarB [Rhizobium lusitanum]NEI72457.1 nickel pincer cofactor biosynthesis protein LarB [Rhizobium lusitanum]
MTTPDVVFDFARAERMGLDEAVLCAGKSSGQIATILRQAQHRGVGLLLTRLSADVHATLLPEFATQIDYCGISRTGFFGPMRPVTSTGMVAIVAAGTSDAPVAREAERTLRHAGVEATVIIDVGVAGLWRLMNRVEDIRRYPVVIAVAGMDAALASVLAGLVAGLVIGVPTSVGYGAVEAGRTALNAMLASCAQGLTVCNIDNGFGAANAALRALAIASNKKDCTPWETQPSSHANS